MLAGCDPDATQSENGVCSTRMLPFQAKMAPDSLGMIVNFAACSGADVLVPRQWHLGQCLLLERSLVSGATAKFVTGQVEAHL